MRVCVVLQYLCLCVMLQNVFMYWRVIFMSYIFCVLRLGIFLCHYTEALSQEEENIYMHVLPRVPHTPACIRVVSSMRDILYIPARARSYLCHQGHSYQLVHIMSCVDFLCPESSFTVGVRFFFSPRLCTLRVS